MDRKYAYESSRDKWIKIIEGTYNGGGDCGFCEWTLREHRGGGGCLEFCPMCPEVCHGDGNLFATWSNNKTTENAMKVLEGVIKYGLPWVEEEDEVKHGKSCLCQADETCPTKKRPEPKFKVGDKVLNNRGTTPYSIKRVEWGDSRRYLYYNDDGSFLLEEFLSFAPKEVWKDVTEECERVFESPSGYHYVELHYKGRSIMELGKDSSWFTPDTSFKLETMEPFSRELTCFKILHLQDEE